ncbi:putative transcriptional regulatory protein C16G5.16 [Lasiodiplodia hormozganensis]|uniref:Transcriptional regulatory protein C16G5.16 n=1 Tax=Lasiodiplodia hormozganensis TaxID=869390 RepID=A0AA39XVU6_9PEZI|nr:C6 transcription factor [Lasiodiplodia theobromae]KAF4544597.1 C6 transcription factor [Lasiodiplodia theobromae]KAK0640005.1 putative transcriptional regulatory protein C16G5.16 [Lasiodiplodia hormozganensis]
MPDGRPKKLQRASRACDFCHKRSIRCKPSESDAQRCQNCVDFDINCAYTRPWRRARGSSAAVKQPASTVAQSTPSDSHPSPAQPHHAIPSYAAPPSVDPTPRKTPDRHLVSYAPRDPLGEAWKSFAMACGPSIRSLMDIYHQIVYPIFPFFHRETLLRNLQQREYLNDRGYFACIMAACSIVASRARDGALAPWITRRAQPEDIPAESFYTAAKDAIQKDLPNAMGLHYLRACALVAIASIQFGKIDTLHEYKGHYFTLCAIQRFSDEAHWPKDITSIEREERRRLFWSTYTLDVYSSIVWSGPLYSCESHYHVRYPAEADGDHLDLAPPGLTDPSCWLHGWNFTTDLYRVLEHTVSRLRSHRNAGVALRPVRMFFTPDAFSGPGVLQSVLDMYSQLHPHFKEIPPVTGDSSKDIFGFQAANIQATMQLLRMVLFSVEENADVEQKCNVAAELLSTFHRVPVPYMKAISTPLIYHLAGIGTILGSVMESPLSEASYQHVRSMLLSMADLLESLESGLYRTQGTSRGLRSQVDRIDEYMRMQRNAMPQTPFQNTIADLTVTVPTHRTTFMPPNSMDTMSQFQLPPELLEDWPWPSDLSQQDFGIVPFGFD